jgi:hypothetical protein
MGFVSSKLWCYNDFLYMTFGEGKEFYKTAELTHKFSNDVIKKRKELLVRTKCFELIIQM